MRTIHKYVLGPGANEISTFERARFLHVHTQASEPVLWVDVNTLQRECMRTIVVVPTGGEVPADGAYLGTAVDVAGVFVFHVYLVLPSLATPTNDAEEATR